MAPKKRKFSESQQTLSEMFVRKSSANVTTEESSGDAIESKQPFLMNIREDDSTSDIAATGTHNVGQ